MIMRAGRKLRTFAVCLGAAVILAGCVGKGKAVGEESDGPEGLRVVSEMQLEYAHEFSVSLCEGGYALIDIGEDGFLLVPEGAKVPADTEGRTVLEQPIENIYMAASSAMDLFDSRGSLDRVKMSAYEEDRWSLENVRQAMERGEMGYAGKYSAPDYELLAAQECDLAVESTMIFHSPRVKEKLEQLGIPVLVERSSYESHPLGRMEWIKLYGLLMGDYPGAEKRFEELTKGLEDLKGENSGDGPKAAFFSLSTGGWVTVHKPGNYFSRMIELAGGRYLFTPEDLNVEENALSTMKIQLESFYEKAAEADVLIYNSTIVGELGSLEELLEKCPVLSDLKAVREGRVWCISEDMFQHTTAAAEMIRELSAVFDGTAQDEMGYLYRLR